METENTLLADWNPQVLRWTGQRPDRPDDVFQARSLSALIQSAGVAANVKLCISKSRAPN
ncbi:MAG: hypothetical protein AAF384_05850 [Pseudomonadota bacterium]